MVEYTLIHGTHKCKACYNIDKKKEEKDDKANNGNGPPIMLEV